MAEPWSPSLLAALPTPDDLVTIGALLLIAVGAAVGIWVKFSVLHAATSNGESAEQRLNCPNCGARNPISRDQCEYCGEALPAEA